MQKLVLARGAGAAKVFRDIGHVEEEVDQTEHVHQLLVRALGHIQLHIVSVVEGLNTLCCF